MFLIIALLQFIITFFYHQQAKLEEVKNNNFIKLSPRLIL